VEGFPDRSDAGRQLAGLLADYRGTDAVVLGLPRGGVPVAAQVAEILDLPLDIFVVRKLGVPGHEELAFGAIASGGVRVLNEDVVAMSGVTSEEAEEVARRETRELERRESAYRGDRPAVSLEGKTAIVVDDGIATGASMRAAIKALKQTGPERVVVAVPVAPPRTVASLEQEADGVAAVLQPDALMAIGAWYEDFSQTTDGEVRDLLERAGSEEAHHRGG
jgi:putative phosphoribosyl transferase